MSAEQQRYIPHYQRTTADHVGYTNLDQVPIRVVKQTFANISLLTPTIDRSKTVCGYVRDYTLPFLDTVVDGMEVLYDCARLVDTTQVNKARRLAAHYLDSSPKKEGIEAMDLAIVIFSEMRGPSQDTLTGEKPELRKQITTIDDFYNRIHEIKTVMTNVLEEPKLLQNSTIFETPEYRTKAFFSVGSRLPDYTLAMQRAQINKLLSDISFGTEQDE